MSGVVGGWEGLGASGWAEVDGEGWSGGLLFARTKALGGYLNTRGCPPLESAERLFVGLVRRMRCNRRYDSKRKLRRKGKRRESDAKDYGFEKWEDRRGGGQVDMARSKEYRRI